MVLALVYALDEAGPADLFRAMRRIHETCAFAWVFLGGLAVAQRSLVGREGGPVRWPVVVAILLWAGAGVAIVAAFLDGRVTGREYLGYPPALAGLIALGWVLFAASYFAAVGPSLAGRPVYRFMWAVAFPFFLFTFLEGHAYLIEAISRRPLRDLAFQWKANGTLVGSFNLLAYGALAWTACRLAGDEAPARSRTAFALFGVGLVNTFTNYGHHTFHLPQSVWIHFVAFGVSMLEVVIVAKYVIDLVGLRRRPRATTLTEAFLRWLLLWSAAMIALGVGISIPPVNTMIHGTHIVVAHAMGAMIGIDSMILWAALALLLEERAGREAVALDGPRRLGLLVLNGALLVFLAALFVRGLAAGWSRYAGPSAPDLSLVVAAFPTVLLASGSVLAMAVLFFIGDWIVAWCRLGWSVLRRRAVLEVDRPAE